MTATVYISVADDDLRAEDAAGNVRIVVGNFGWTMLLENRLDCARWMKAIADADALFIRRKAAAEANAVVVPPARASRVIDAFEGMTGQQKSAWVRDVPEDCPCDYIWTGMVWTRSGSTPACELHAGEDVSLPGLGAQGEPATGASSAPGLNIGQGHKLHMPCGCPYPKIGDHRPCIHGYRGDEDDPDDPRPPLPQRTPAGPPQPLELVPVTDEEGNYSPAFLAALRGEDDDTPRSHAAGDFAELSPQALAGSEPLESLAPEPQEGEAQE